MSELFGRLKIHEFRKRSRLVRSKMPNHWHMLSSSVTEEYDHAGSNEFHPDAAQTVALEQGQADRGKAPAATQTRLVNPDEAPDQRPRSRPRHVQSGNRQQASWL